MHFIGPKPFSTASYQTQVSRLRAVALEALARYPLRVKSVDFINHGENTTFKVKARRERSFGRSHPEETFLLRVHRAGYHSPQAIHEELDWLAHLKSTAIAAPRPVQSRTGEWIESVRNPLLDAERLCDLLEWVDGRFVFKNVRPLHMQKIGRALAELQLSAVGRKVRHRKYWTADGLIGPEAKFGSVHAIQGIKRSEQSRLTGAANDLLREFRSYSKSKPRKRGLIHADLHFGNAVFRDDGSFSAIDFDDCGLGFYLYDLAVPLVNIEHIVELKPALSFDEMRAALIDGYASVKTFDSNDEEMLDLFRVCRRIIMVGWLNSRADNPKLAPRIPGAVAKALKAIATLR